MAGSEQGRRRMGYGWRAAAAGTVIAVAMLGLAASASASPPARPVPVPYRDAELSVPGSWVVETPQQVSCGLQRADGMIFAGTRPEIPKGTGCGLTASLAWLLPAGHIPAGIQHRKPTAVIHGIPVYRLHSAKGSVLYLVPELKVRAGARGPAAQRVLATLNRSPL